MAMRFQQQTFVPPALRRVAPACVPAVTLLGAGAAPAFADEIGDAAATLAKAAYPFMKEVPWDSNLYSLNPGSKDAVSWAKAIGKMIDMGASMDPKLLNAGAAAHHSAIVSLASNPSSSLVCSEAQLTKINAAIGRMIASVPEAKTMDVYNSVSALVDPKVPEYLMSTVKEEDAKAAYAALIDFTKVVKANPITPSAPSSSLSRVGSKLISVSADDLSKAAYPFIKDIDWTSPLYAKPIPGIDAKAALKAVDKMIVMGTEMDSAALQEAARAHAKAIEGMDATGVLSQADFAAINAGLGKAISSVPTEKVMDVFNAVGGLLGESPIPNYLYSKVNPQDALAAYNALLEFKDVVKAAPNL